MKVILAFYITWILLHYAASHLYTHFCTSWSIYGFFFSSFIVSSAHCKALRWLVFTGSDHIHFMWMLLGAWASKCLTYP